MCKMGKDKKEKRKSEGGEEQGPSYEDLLTGLNPIANPVANRKLNKKLLKCTKKGERKYKNLSLNYKLVSIIAVSIT